MTELALALPPHIVAERKAREKAKKKPENTASQLPAPAGYKILIALPEVEEQTEGGIIKSAQTIYAEEITSVTGFVLAMGPDAYADKKRFPSGPYCKVGDFVIMRAYAGTRLSIYGKEFRLLNDESIEAVVDDPRGIKKI